MVYCYVMGIPSQWLAHALALSGEDDVVIEAGKPGSGLTVNPSPRGGGSWWLWG